MFVITERNLYKDYGGKKREATIREWEAQRYNEAFDSIMTIMLHYYENEYADNMLCFEDAEGYIWKSFNKKHFMYKPYGCENFEIHFFIEEE